MSLFTKLFNFVLLTSSKYKIDESHGLSHSMDVLYNAHKIYQSEIPLNPILLQQEKIILTSAALHDMCDKKYMNEFEGMKMIEEFLEDKLDNEEIDITKRIITTMSYSTVKKNGFPILGPYQHAYHIVREADLLSAYDFDRCMIYNMNKKQSDFEEAFVESYNLFQNRVLRHNEDGLLLTDYSIRKSHILENKALSRIDHWRKILKISRI
jgi:HD superfamily phosphodiesterase